MSNCNKILILCNSKVFPETLFIRRDVNYYQFYEDKVPGVLKIFRRMTLKISFFRKRMWYGKWFQKWGTYNKVILFSINGIDDIVEDIKDALLPHQKLVIFFWDPVFRTKECLKYEFNKYSFDIEDCKRYNLNFNSTFYFKNILYDFQNNTRSNLILFDVYFIGLNKGRNKIIQVLEEDFNKLNVSTNFILIDENKVKNERVTFEQNLENISQSKAILDIVQDNQSGLTVRVMESIYFRKKLITNNKSVKNELLYNPKNIFILGKDDLKNLKKFLEIPYDQTYSDEFIEYYDFQNWIKRFDLN